MGGDQQIFTAESRPLTIWSSSKQGWLSTGISGTAFLVSKDRSLSVYGHNASNSTWKSVYVDWRTEIPGVGSVTLKGYGENAQFQGQGDDVEKVSTGGLGVPLVFNTALGGAYACIDSPTTTGPLVIVGTSDRCTRVGGKQWMRGVGLTFAESKSGKSRLGIISLTDFTVYVFESGPSSGQWAPIKISEEIFIKSGLQSRDYWVWDVISTLEKSIDLNITSPKLKFSGFFNRI